MKPKSPITAAHIQRRPSATASELAERAARRSAAEADAHAQARRAARHLMDICEAVRPADVTLRAEPTMAEAVAAIRTRGPQPPLDYAPRAPLDSPTPARRAAQPVLFAIVFLAGVLLGMGL